MLLDLGRHAPTQSRACRTRSLLISGCSAQSSHKLYIYIYIRMCRCIYIYIYIYTHVFIHSFVYSFGLEDRTENELPSPSSMKTSIFSPEDRTEDGLRPCTRFISGLSVTTRTLVCCGSWIPRGVWEFRFRAYLKTPHPDKQQHIT